MAARFSAWPDLRQRALRFGAAGALVGAIYISVTAVLAKGVGLPLQAAIAIGYCAAVSTHFLLQRHFVWASDDVEYARSGRYQLGLFVAMVLVQYAVTAAAVAVLPGLLGLDRTLVWLGVVAVITVASFVILRTRVFHHEG